MTGKSLWPETMAMREIALVEQQPVLRITFEDDREGHPVSHCKSSGKGVGGVIRQQFRNQWLNEYYHWLESTIDK